jgi:hypothetical protein
MTLLERNLRAWDVAAGIILRAGQLRPDADAGQDARDGQHRRRQQAIHRQL